jgi:VIT1/CCC1 family predicted Fe2+/Mn2+ transporter
MSAPTSQPDATLRSNPRVLLTEPHRALVASVQFLGFWSAVLLPLVLFPMLVTGAAAANVPAFAGLLAANLLALVLGREHNRD